MNSVARWRCSAYGLITMEMHTQLVQHPLHRHRSSQDYLECLKNLPVGSIMQESMSSSTHFPHRREGWDTPPAYREGLRGIYFPGVRGGGALWV